MKKILVTSQKGGTGKTFLADELAYSLERTRTSFAFFELDSQGGQQHEPSEPPDAETAIIDTPGYLMDDAADLVRDADVIVLPTRASATDMPALQRMRTLIRSHAPDTPVVIVLNAWNHYSNARSFAEWLQSTRTENETLVSVPQSEAVPQGAGAGKSVHDISRKSRVASKLRTTTNHVRRLIGLPEEEIIPFPETPQANGGDING